MPVDKATFVASFPLIQSALKIGPDGMRLQLDVPENQMAEAVKVLAWRQMAVWVTIEPYRAGRERNELSQLLDSISGAGNDE